MITFEDLTPQQREYYEWHANQIPPDWDWRKLPIIRIPERVRRVSYSNRSEDYNSNKPMELKCIEFEVKRVYRGLIIGEESRLALVANKDIIVKWMDR